jgi:iron complex transport system substrate-binding protein
MTRLRLPTLIACLLLFFVASSPARSESAQAGPVRVATLLPFVEDALALAPERAVVVASVRRSLHAPLVEGVIDLGNPHSPSFEKLAEARAELVIADRTVHGRYEAALGAGNARVLMLETSGIESTLVALGRVSEAIGGSETIDGRVSALRQEIADLALHEATSLLALFGSPGSFFVMTERAWLGDLVVSLGLQNAVERGGDERFPGLVPVSDEVMALARPDLVLLVAHGDPRKIRADLERRTARGGAWAGLAKARLGIHVLDPTLFSANPGLELGRAAQQLVRLASPTPGVPTP